MHGQTGRILPRRDDPISHPAESSLSAYLPPMPESSWHAQILGMLRLFGWSWWHDDATNNRERCRCGAEWVCTRGHRRVIRRNVKGFPDLVIWRGPFMILPELKTEDGKLSDAQQIVNASMADVLFARPAIWRPRHSNAIVEILREPGKAFARILDMHGQRWLG